MKGDFTRFTFNKEKHYSGVYMQQGRVQMDADWNEYVEIQAHRQQTEAKDVIGLCGVPVADDGFKIGELKLTAFLHGVSLNGGKATDDGGEEWTPGTLPVNYTISAGRIYVDGILCELEDDATYLNQPDYPNPPALSPPPADGNPRTDLVYLDVWQRHITAIENPDIRETALGGPDTATRVKTVWQVKVEEGIAAQDVNITCETQITGWPPSSSGGCLSTRVSATDIEEKRCLIPPSAGYGGLENQLYRVEIHDGGQPYVWPRPAAVSSIRVVALDAEKCQVTVEDPLDGRPWEPGQMVEVFIFISPETDAQGKPGVLACILEVDESLQTLTLDTDLSDLSGNGELWLRRVASFKWSHDNGSVVFPVQEFVGGQLTNKIKVKGLGRDPVVRLGLGDWVEVSDDDSELKGEPGTLAKIIEPIDETTKEFTLSKEISGYSKEAHPKARRWDQKTETVAVTDGPINFENGVQVLFSGSDFKTGDYWVFPARTSTRQIEELDNEPSRGIKHHYCELALVSWEKTGEQWHASVLDCRPRFASLAGLTSLTRLFYVGGDGQEAMPNKELPQPLVVGVADGKGPVHGARVRFEITDGGGKLKDGDSDSEGKGIELLTEDGLAKCWWELGGVDENGGEKPPPPQQVVAHLVDDGSKTQLPIYFNANLSVAEQVYYQSGKCNYLKSVDNVQDAIDSLCNRLSRIWPWWIIIVAVFGLLAGISTGMLIGQSQG
jgi:hypothetical protein